MLDLQAEVKALGPELWNRLRKVVEAGTYILGPEVEAFEREAATYLGVRHAVGLNSGTDALVIALRALGVKRGDDVITTPFTFFATTEAVLALGAKPVFVDIEPDTFNLDARLISKAITKRTRAILPVHLYGLPCDMPAIQEIADAAQIPIVEDAAQAFGADFGGKKVGTFGRATALSFFPSKTLGAFGDAGMVVTDDPELAHTARMLRAHGSARKYYNEMVGYNSRLDEIQAAILRLKLQKVDAWNDRRRVGADHYWELLGGTRGIVLPVVPAGRTHVFHQYTIRVLPGRRDKLRQELLNVGIGTMIYYPIPINELPIMAPSQGSFPNAKSAAQEVLSLPSGPFNSPAAREEVGKSIAQFLADV
jgi:dTDP-4-amino-4,6-dideoxygalactose transaminase